MHMTFTKQRKVVQDFCGGEGSLVCHILEKLEAVYMDAASNETESARLLKQPANGGPPLAPNLKAIIRDKAHASRRIISRP